MIVGLLMGSHSIAQKTKVTKPQQKEKSTDVRESCVPFDASRTIEQFRSLILYGEDPFIWKELWPEYVRLVSRGLKSSKDSSLRTKYLGNDQSSVAYIMSHSFEYDSSLADWRDFRNGTKVNEQLQYTNLKGSPSNWVVFRDKDIEMVYAKIVCANSQDDKNPPQPYVSPVIPPAPAKPEPKKEFTDDLPSFADVDKVDNIKNVVYDEPKKDYPSVARVARERRPVKIHIGLGFNFGGGYSGNRGFIPQGDYPIRTGGYGVSGNNGSGNGGGLDGDPRTGGYGN